MSNENFLKLEKFIEYHQEEFVDVLQYIESFSGNFKGQRILGKAVEISVYILRKIRGFHQ